MDVAREELRVEFSDLRFFKFQIQGVIIWFYVILMVLFGQVLGHVNSQGHEAKNQTDAEDFNHDNELDFGQLIVDFCFSLEALELKEDSRLRADAGLKVLSVSFHNQERGQVGYLARSLAPAVFLEVGLCRILLDVIIADIGGLLDALHLIFKLCGYAIVYELRDLTSSAS